MLTLTYTAADSALAERLQQDLGRADAELAEANALIAVLSPGGVQDAEVRRALTDALNRGRTVIPVLAAPVSLPPEVAALSPLDLSARYDFAALKTRLERLVPRETTPEQRASNRRIFYVLVALALVMFVMGLYLVGVMGVQFPADEYNAADTVEAATINAVLNPLLETNQPRTTDEAANFLATVQAAPTGQRPLLIGTATAIAESNR
jgi:hypothetical protein